MFALTEFTLTEFALTEAALTEAAQETEHPLVSLMSAAQARIGAQERELLRIIAQGDEGDTWIEWGARSYVHWLSMRLGISVWKAQRFIAAATALETLPLISGALVSGQLSLDKVIELTRFASAKDERKLIEWAQEVSGAAIRHRGNLEIRSRIKDMVEAEENRSVTWWHYPDDRFGLLAVLPAAQGAQVALALDRLAESIPVMSGEEGGSSAAQRRADALVVLASTKLSEDADPDRATVIVRAKLEGLAANTSGCEIENGPVIHPETVRRLLCNARVQTIVEDEGGNVLAVGRMHREPSAWMQRQVRYRDKECRFPGCGARAFTQAHHVKFWSHGGRTELANLLLICSFHHRLVHELRWKVTRARDGTVRWYRPDESEYRAGPSPG